MINRSSLLVWIVLLCIGCSFGVASANDVCDDGPGDCELVRNEPPQIWICDCGSPTPNVSPTMKPTNKPVSAPKMCGCDSCTDQVLSNMADGYTCGARIDWVISNLGLSEAESCKIVAGEFPSICGACHADHCGAFPPTPNVSPTLKPTNKPVSAPKMCGCDSCTDQVLSNMADGYTCGARIDWLMSNQGLSEAESCKRVGDEFPSICGACHADHCGAFPPTPNVSPTLKPTNKPVSAPKMCGCDSCTDQVLSNMADGYTCGARIDWLMSNQGLSEAESCKRVGDEFPSICGACHADHCGAFPPTPSPVPNQGVTVRAMSYNTEYSGYSDGRLPNFAAKMREVAADIVGVQECQNPNGLASASGYAVLTNTGPQNYIFYKNDRLQALNRGYMNIPRDNFSQRTITWGQFRVIKGNGAGSEFWFFNTHLPHRHNQAADWNTHARIGQSLLAKRRELGAENSPTIVVGDCNPFASAGAPEGSFESNLATGGIVKVYQAQGNTGGHAGLDKIFASKKHWSASNAADRGTGSSDHPAISADLSS